MSLSTNNKFNSTSSGIDILILPIVFFLVYYNVQYQRHSIIEITSDNITVIEKKFLGDTKDSNYKFYDIISGLNEEQANFLSNKINEMILYKRKQVS